MQVRPFFSLCLTLTILVGICTGQEATPPSIEQPVEKPEAPKKVDVKPVARDEQIANRLQDILIATEWFRDPTVEVTDGVVFLSGVAAESDYRTWATNLAQNTQDVAAVVNRMTVRQRSLFDMSPAIAEMKTLSANSIQTAPLVLFGLIVIMLTWLLARAASRIASWLFRERIGNPLLRRVVSQAMMIPVLLFGIYVVLRVSGLTQLALTVLGGTGIAGLIIGIAFRDIAENFLASILISVQNPFRSGDLIEVGEHKGFVQRVSTRGTLLMTREGNHVQIPNSAIYKSTVINYSANPNRRFDFVVGIGYDDSITEAQEVIRQVLDLHPNVLSSPESQVILDELGSSTVNVRVLVWIDASKNNPDVVRSSVMRIVKQSLLDAGISLPDEAREVIFPNNVPVFMLDANAKSKSPKNADAVRERPDDGPPAEPKPTEQIRSPGEGRMESDDVEIQRQADLSWTPENDTDLLESEPEPRKH